MVASVANQDATGLSEMGKSLQNQLIEAAKKEALAIVSGTERTAEQKERGLKCEILNGRAAMVGIIGMLSASTVPGSVPFLSGIEGFPQYAGNVMVPFSNDFTLTSMA